MYDTYEVTENTENGCEKVTYSCEVKDMQYTIIGEDIKEDFDFLVTRIPSLLDDTLKNLRQGTQNENAFYFEGSSKVQNLQKLYDEIKNDVEKIKVDLNELHSALLLDIDNVNAELASNFGHIAFYSTSEACREVISTGDE